MPGDALADLVAIDVAIANVCIQEHFVLLDKWIAFAEAMLHVAAACLTLL
jgi:hypothetical protein